jgi:signal recognition particle subunit SRP14
LATRTATVTSKTNPSKKEAASLSPEELCLVRATLGKKKVSCTIPFKDTATFSRQMNNVLKAHIDNLKEKSVKTPKKDAKKAAAPAASPTAASSSKK